jgi:citrate synthase
MLERLSDERGSRTWFDLSTRILETVVAEKGLQPNVDFYSASVYAMLEIPRDLFTPIFAISRMSGWTAHLLEQWADNRLIRPREAYVGPSDRTVPPIGDRRPG